MTVALSRTEKKKKKRQVKRQVKEWGIELKEISERSGYHRNTVSKALDEEDKYYSQDIIDAAEGLVEERKIIVQP